MRFRVTSVAGSAEGTKLNAVTVKLEDHLNSDLGALEFGSNLDQFTLVVVSVYDEPEENEKLCKAHRKVATARNPVTGESVRYLSIALPLAPKQVEAVQGSSLAKLIAAAAEKVLPVRPPRLPAGLDFSRLSAAVSAALVRGSKSAA